MESPDLLSKLGKNASKRMINNFSWHQTALEYVRIIDIPMLKKIKTP